MKDILLFISDQHSYNLQANAGNSIVRTPNMDSLSENGVTFTDAMTSCPLCVPARMSFLSGQLPSRTGILDNLTGLDSNQATFVHSLNAAGYETVLCGRMHFVGPDQRHGYAKRIAGDKTPVFINQPRDGHENGPFRGFIENAAIHYMGPGNSPVLAYDDYVTKAAVEYLAVDHEEPQFLTVGTYGPHFPYTAPEDLYNYYYDKVELDENDYDSYKEHPVFSDKLHDDDPEVVRAARANYYGMTEYTDQKLGEVIDAFLSYTKRMGHEAVIIYTSDHGDMNGQRGYYGKTTFYDDSVHIPWIMAGDGLPKGRKITTPTSIMDIGPTLCELTGAAQTPRCDGKSQKSAIEGVEDPDRTVISEVVENLPKGKYSVGRMIKWKNWKYFEYTGYEESFLFDCEKDKSELSNVAGEHLEIVALMKQKLKECPSLSEYHERKVWLDENKKILMKCNFDSDERWRCPDEAKIPLKHVVSSKQEERQPRWLADLIEMDKMKK